MDRKRKVQRGYGDVRNANEMCSRRDGRGMDEVWAGYGRGMGSKMHPPNEILIINYYLLIQKIARKDDFLTFSCIYQKKAVILYPESVETIHFVNKSVRVLRKITLF